jgi:hypothetical protein
MEQTTEEKISSLSKIFVKRAFVSAKLTEK